MAIKNIHLKQFKRFTDLKINNIPAKTKLVVLLGPNGSGKTSLLEAFNWFNRKHKAGTRDPEYFHKIGVSHQTEDDVNINFHSSNPVGFYFRSAHRNEPNFTVSNFKKPESPDSIKEMQRLPTLSNDDKTVGQNHQRLLYTILDKFMEADGSITVEKLKDELFGMLQNAISNIFGDLKLAPFDVNNPNFYFYKNSINEKFHYKNLSAGEKGAFDLVLDIFLKHDYFKNGIFCIEEPELHMHTSLQSKVIRELYNFIPDNSQLWISTHSIGIFKEADEINKEQPDTVVFLDFSDHNFDEPVEMLPTSIDKTISKRFFEIALGDFANLVLPETIIFCEGDPNGKGNKRFDSAVYNAIFEKTKPNSQFISVGSRSEVEKINTNPVFNALLKKPEIKIIRFIDRDSASANEVAKLNNKGIRLTSYRHIEAYLFADEILKKLFDKEGSQKFNEFLALKQEIMDKNQKNGKFSDDIKSASGELYNKIMQILDLTRAGNNTNAFMRDTLAPLVTQDTEVYKKLKNDIFGQTL